MAYLIITANGEEIDRRELTAAVSVGRSGECDIPIHDVLLSRLHCRIEPFNETGHDGKRRTRWRVRDLGSRNGTHINWKKVGEQTLSGGDQLRLGRTWATFHAGEFVAAERPVETAGTRRVRPADPHEALMGTVSDFVFVERDSAAEDFDATPSPLSRPSLPTGSPIGAGDAEAELWSASIATAVAAVRRRSRPRPQPVGLYLPVHRSVPTDLSLQAEPALVPLLEPISLMRPQHSLSRALNIVLVAVAVCVATAAVLLSGWALTQ